MPTPIRISRRSLLRGAGGAALALPFLEVMNQPRAYGQSTGGTGGSPKRYVVMFAGLSTGRDGVDLIKPMGTGAGWTSNTALAPIDARGVRRQVGIVSNLNIPLTGPGSRPAAFHSSTPGPLLSGVTATSADPTARGPTSDQIVASRFAERYTDAERMRLRPSVAWRVQAEAYRGGEGPKGRMSYQRDPRGALIPTPQLVSPSVIYSTVFGGMTGGDPMAAAREARRRQSVLDLVGNHAQAVAARLGRADQLRLQRHLDEVRALERAVGVVATGGGACMTTANPGMDPTSAHMTAMGGVTVGYSDERRRADLLGAMLFNALSCDMTRVASLMVSYAQCFVNAAALLPAGLPGGAVLDVHEVGHWFPASPAVRDSMAQCIAWHVDVFAQLVSRLASVPDGTGTLLDSTAVVLVFEGGMGRDPSTGAMGVTHSTENMAALYAGGGLRGAGQHIDGAHAHPASVLLSAMRAVGVTDPLGEITTTLPALVG